MMKIFNKLAGGLVGLSFALTMAFATNVAHANPACFQYNPSGNFTTSTTPVFNNICGDTTTINSTNGPVPLGDESNFVRIREDTSGVDTSNATNPALADSVNSVCNSGSKFDVWTYVHNDAMSAYNDNGAGSAVAHDVQLALSAPGLGTTTGPNGGTFKFTSTVSASNAETVSDSATLNCNGQEVQLTLVPSSVNYTTDVASPTWTNLSDGHVNSTFPIGNPVWGSGDQWGCYNYRVIVVYQVTTKVIPPQPTPPVCNLLKVEGSGEVAKLDSVNYTANSATVTGISVDFGNGTTKVLQPSQFPYTYTYATAGNYTITATVLTNQGNVTSAGCTAIVTTSTTPTTPITPVTPQTPTELVNTGPGSVIGIFAATAILAGVGRHLYKTRKFAGLFRNTK
jgi:hypothetical protein